MHEREREWAGLMQAANAGDAAAYARLLHGLAAVLRAAARRDLARVGLAESDAEDVVQETLLAIHLKRRTWRSSDPIGPWLRAIARNKLIDALRRRSRRAEQPIDDLLDVLPAEETRQSLDGREVDRHLASLSQRQREVVAAIAVEGASIAATAARLRMSEGAVRVALHRGLAALADRSRTP